MTTHANSLDEATDRFCQLMNDLNDEAFQQRVVERSTRLQGSIGHVPDEYIAVFNEVLPGGGFTGPPVMGTLSTSPSIAKETAAILCKVSLSKGRLIGQVSSDPQHLGWNFLNNDAKGWCRALLLAHPPNNASAEELRDLLTAKQFAAILQDHLLPCTPRSVAAIDKEDVLGFPVDE